MLFIISPAKSLDFTPIKFNHSSIPQFLSKADNLAKKLGTKSPGQLQKLFHISEDLAQLNFDRYQSWDIDKIGKDGKQALFAFSGHVYQKIEPSTLDELALNYAAAHIRILSGMYGVLKPSDLIHPHRLEMGTKWAVTKKNLYGYWTKHVTKALNDELNNSNNDTLINLASNEYFKVIDKKQLKGRIINIDFKEKRSSGKYAVVSMYAKQARGLMCRFACQNQISLPEELMAFESEGYIFNHQLSTADSWVFARG